MLGWHRNFFNKAISESAKISENINWFDFDFNGPEDKELLNIDFIEELKNKWRKYWVCGGGSFGLNWDVVGLSDDGTYVLVEAKANLDEMLKTPPAGGSDESKNKNDAVIQQFVQKYKINKTPSDLDTTCYQFTNRLIALDFLLSHGYKAKLVYVLFENGFEFNASSNRSVSKEEWQNAFEHELELSGIIGTEIRKMVSACIIDCNNKKSPN